MPSQSPLTETLSAMLEPARLFPMVRPPGYAQGADNNQRGMVNAMAQSADLKIVPMPRFSRSLQEGLSIELVSDHGTTMMPLNAQCVPESFHEAVWRSALLNLDSASLEPFVPSRTAGVYEGPWKDGYDASRVLLLPKLFTRCNVKGDVLVFAPTVGTVWVTGSEDIAGMGVVLNAVDELLRSGEATSPYQYREILFGWPWMVRDGRLQRWNVPEGHPMAEAITALDAQLEKRRRDSIDHVQAFAETVYTQGERKAGSA
jgi:hypothetical protein